MSETLTKDQQDAARKAAKAEKERQRKAEIKLAQEIGEKAGLDPDVKLDADQRKRAITAAEKHAGLSGNALAVYILEGKTMAEQAKEAKEGRAQKEAQEGKVSRARRSKDPEAADLAVAAAALAPDVKSAFLPKDARVFLDDVLKGREAKELLKDAIPAAEEGKMKDLPVSRLEAFSRKGEKDAEVRAFLRDTGSGTRLWGRKLGLFIVEQLRRDA